MHIIHNAAGSKAPSSVDNLIVHEIICFLFYKYERWVKIYQIRISDILFQESDKVSLNMNIAKVAFLG